MCSPDEPKRLKVEPFDEPISGLKRECQERGVGVQISVGGSAQQQQELDVETLQSSSGKCDEVHSTLIEIYSRCSQLLLLRLPFLQFSTVSAFNMRQLFL